MDPVLRYPAKLMEGGLRSAPRLSSLALVAFPKLLWPDASAGWKN